MQNIFGGQKPPTSGQGIFANTPIIKLGSQPAPRVGAPRGRG